MDYICDELIGRQRKFADIHMTFGFYYYLLEILFRHGRDELALELMRAYYGRWLKMGGTTFGEHFDLQANENKKKVDWEYEVHGYGTSAHLHFYTNILGIVPLEPGFKKVLFRPHPGNLKRAKGSIHTPQGEISVSWNVSGSVFKMEIKTPKACEYSIIKPDGFAKYQLKIKGARCRLTR